MRKILIFCFVFCCMSMQLFAQDSFFENTEEEESGENFSSGGNGKKSSFEFSGFANLGIRIYPHKDMKRTEAVPVFGISFKYQASKTELEARLKCNALTITGYPLDLLDEFTLRAYLGDFVLSAGKMKIVWGRGDMLHVLDVFNANDFTDFTIPTYIDRRIGEPMVHIAYNAPVPLRLEAAWAPLMTPDRLPLKGAWVPPQIETMKRTAADALNTAISNNGFSKIFDEQTLQKMLHDPIASQLQALAAAMPFSITIEMKDILSKLDSAALLDGISPLVKAQIRILLENLAKQKITFSVTEIANKILPPKSDGSAYTEAEIRAMLNGEPFLTEFTGRIAKEISERGAEAEKELAAGLKKAAAIIGGLQLDEFMKQGMNALLPDMHKIEYGQYGLRLSGSAGPADMALQYYYGRYKTPSFDTAKMVQNAAAGKSIGNCIYYDPVHIFGADFGAVAAMFNLKSEFAYYMTSDFKGNNPAVHNNSLRWILGFDVDIPLNNLNLNIQNIGTHVLGFKKVKRNNSEGHFDMDWNTAEKSTNNKLIFTISDSWLHESLTDSVTVIWGIEHNDAIIMPRIKYKIKDGFYTEGRGAYIYAKNKKSEFASWKNNHFVQLSFDYRF